MKETIGTINLKIAQLELQLKLLHQRQILSQPYPKYKKQLAYQDKQVRLALSHLIQNRDQMARPFSAGPKN